MLETFYDFNKVTSPELRPTFSEVLGTLETLMGDKWTKIIGQPDFAFAKTCKYERKQVIHGITYNRQITVGLERKSNDVRVIFTVKKDKENIASSTYNIPHINNGDCLNLFAKCAEVQIEIFDTLDQLEVRDDTAAAKKARKERSKI